MARIICGKCGKVLSGWELDSPSSRHKCVDWGMRDSDRSHTQIPLQCPTCSKAALLRSPGQPLFKCTACGSLYRRDRSSLVEVFPAKTVEQLLGSVGSTTRATPSLLTTPTATPVAGAGRRLGELAAIVLLLGVVVYLGWIGWVYWG